MWPNGSKSHEGRTRISLTQLSKNVTISYRSTMACAITILTNRNTYEVIYIIIAIKKHTFIRFWFPKYKYDLCAFCESRLVITF